MDYKNDATAMMDIGMDSGMDSGMDTGAAPRNVRDIGASEHTEHRDVRVSLLPAAFVELCDMIGCPWASLPLPQTIVAGSRRIALSALNLSQVGDLGAVSPLAVLVLADARHALDAPADDLWPQALAAASALIGRVLESVMAQSLAQYVAPPVAADNEQSSRPQPEHPAPRVQTSDSSISALFFAPKDVIETLGWAYQPGIESWACVSGAPYSRDASDCYPGQAPLLSLAAQCALEEEGFDLSAPLDVLDLTVRTRNCLRVRARARSLADLVSQTPETLFEYRNFGPKSYVDVVSALRSYLAPWLARLPAAIITGADEAEDASDDAEPAPAEPEQPSITFPSESASRANPFAALENSDLVAALDLYGVPWRDIPVAALAPETVARPLADFTEPDVVTRPALPGAAPPLDETQANLRLLAQWMVGRGLNTSFADAPLGALVDGGADADADAMVAHASIAPILDEITTGLVQLLLQHVVRLDASQDASEHAIAMLTDVTIADLLTELMNAPGERGVCLKRNEVVVLYARNGLHTGKPQTLDATGRLLGVTRARVGQIELKAKDRLEQPEIQPPIQALGALAALAVCALGGVASLADAAAQLGAWVSFGAVHPAATTRFLAEWRPDITITKDDLLVALPATEELVRQTQGMLHDLVKQQPDISRGDLITQTTANWHGQGMAVDEPFAAAVLATTPKIAARDERYQLAGRGGKTQRIIHAMRSLGQPAKVAEIGAEYRRLYPEDSQCRDNSIRAFFDRFHDLFVVIGMSTYALAEWGYDPRINDIGALVEHLLEESDRPLHREEVVERAIARYYWKAQSIRAQLETNEGIQKFGDGYFGLRGRDYGDFTAAAANAGDSGDGEDPMKPARERLVVGVFTNERGHQVVRFRLSERCLSGYLPLTNQPMRALFPKVGKFRAEVWPASTASHQLVLSRTFHDVSGFRPFFDDIYARAGDALFIERLTSDVSDSPDACDDAATFLIALGHAGDLAGAMEAVGLTCDDEGATTSDMPVLYYTRKPHRLAALIGHAVEHPWMSLSEVNAALNCLPGNPAGREYLRLAQATGLVATGQTVAGGPTIARPTALGRKWAFTPDSAWGRGRKLALSLPAYRAHLRALGGIALADGALDAQTQRLGEQVIATWDRVCGITPGASAVRALETSAALLSTDLLAGPALPLLLLLLMAQTQGQGLALHALDELLGGQARAALGRLRALGLAIAEDEDAHVALAERIHLAVASLVRVAAALQTSIGDERIAAALAQTWVNALRAVAHRRPLRASDLYDELHALAPDFLYTTLARAPAATPEYARDVDMALPFCGFPMLAGDWALTPVDCELPNAGKYWTVPSDSSGDSGNTTSTTSTTPIGVALCDELLRQPWDAEQHLAGNAHLAVLVVIAADEERLAEHLTRAEDGWRLAGNGLIPALDALLSTLGYDVWNERYRHDPGQQTRLGDTLVALAERLHLVEARGARLEAVSGPATRLYYKASDLRFTERLSVALLASLAPA